MFTWQLHASLSLAKEQTPQSTGAIPLLSPPPLLLLPLPLLLSPSNQATTGQLSLPPLGQSEGMCQVATMDGL